MQALERRPVASPRAVALEDLPGTVERLGELVHDVRETVLEDDRGVPSPERDPYQDEGGEG